MKKSVLALSLVTALNLQSVPTFAEEGLALHEESYGNISTIKEGTTFGLGAIVGGLVAGPIGVMAGAMTGATLGQELTKADKFDEVNLQMDVANSELKARQLEIIALKNQLHIAQQQKIRLHELAMTNLEFQVLFKTGNDELNQYTGKKLDELAEFLIQNQELSVRLHGYADPRGTEEYNNVLAMYRAENVKNSLQARGVDETRIETRSYGADQSKAQKGDLDAYALERRVTIEVFNRAEDLAIAN
jgi:outer membrane protein OmpA-like peptidoglycan-associated protein